jgi:hypothetical protein
LLVFFCIFYDNLMQNLMDFCNAHTLSTMLSTT